VNIGIVTDFYYPWIGGPSTVIRNIGHGLAARGHSVSLLAPSASGAAATENDGPMTVTRARSIRVPFGYNLRASLVPRGDIRRWFDTTTPDIVHVHHPFPLSALAIRQARLRGIPIAATNHTIPECSLWGIRHMPWLFEPASKALGMWIVRLLESCNAVATPTQTAAIALRAIGFRGGVRAISNGVDTERFQPRVERADLKRRFGLDDRPTVLYTGRLDAEKEMDVWLRAAAIVRRSIDVQFVVGGNGSERARLQSLAARLGLDGHVHFVGYLDEKAFPDVYALADLYCITSRVELQSISTLEAIASGLAIVGVHAGALPELILNGQNGRLCEPGNENEVSAAIVDILEDEARRATMGVRSRELAMTHALEATVSAYDEFLTATKSGC
jgi:1,2-diacylglycerol 3-alpha-glucosyltransferase